MRQHNWESPGSREARALAREWCGIGTEQGTGAWAHRCPAQPLSHRSKAQHQQDRPRKVPGSGQRKVWTGGWAGLPGLKKAPGEGPEGTGREDSLLSDELAVHRDQPEVHLEQVLEHAQLLPQVALALCAVSIDGNEQAFSELQAQRAFVSQPHGTPLTSPDVWGQEGDSGPRGFDKTFSAF